jgi:hypothetical protein
MLIPNLSSYRRSTDTPVMHYWDKRRPRRPYVTGEDLNLRINIDDPYDVNVTEKSRHVEYESTIERCQSGLLDIAPGHICGYLSDFEIINKN